MFHRGLLRVGRLGVLKRQDIAELFGLSFQTLTEQTRQDLALGLLNDSQHSLSEIAFLTGFSEQSAFTRAFKRWVGQTPASYRKSAVPARGTGNVTQK